MLALLLSNVVMFEKRILSQVFTYMQVGQTAFSRFMPQTFNMHTMVVLLLAKRASSVTVHAPLKF